MNDLNAIAPILLLNADDSNAFSEPRKSFNQLPPTAVVLKRAILSDFYR